MTDLDREEEEKKRMKDRPKNGGFMSKRSVDIEKLHSEKYNPMNGEKFRPDLPKKTKHSWYKPSTNLNYLRRLQDDEKSGWTLLYDQSIAESAYGSDLISGRDLRYDEITG